MNRRPIGRLSCLVHLGSISVSIATGVFAIILLKYHGQHLSRASLISIITGELVSVISIPFLFLHLKSSVWELVSLGTVSSLLSLGAGLYFINNLVVTEIPRSINPKLLISLIGLLISSQFLHGLSLSTHFHSLQKILSIGTNSQYGSDIENTKEKAVCLKASAATLVESRKTSGNQESVKTQEQQSLFQSTKSRFSSKASSSSLSDNHAPNTLSAAPFYSIKKLSIINQSSSSTNISIAQSHQPSIHTTTPTESSAKDLLTAKNLSLERDALKRIPSALLPPHLKPQSKEEEIQPALKIKTSVSQSNLVRGSVKENIPQSIPRAATFQNIFPGPHTEQSNGMKTITPTDFEQGYENFQFQQLRGPLEPPKRLMKAAHFGDSETEGDEGRFPISDDDTKENDDDNVSNLSNQSTEEALKMVENAQEKGSNEFIRDVMDQSMSTLQLEKVTTPTPLSKSNSYSPHKSIFKSHGRKDSAASLSFKNFSVSMPSSPRRKSIINSPKKMRMKNLSLSSIVFKDTDDDLPNLSYVHELQSSPSKKRRGSAVATTPTKNKHFEKILAEKSNTTPESNWSDNSHKSIFPSEVIGEYDKEKWKTMERLQLVKKELEYPGQSA